ncbi:uncharacterized protein LOC126688279 [Mercurialis annua]|uniref:uncharacterized protein LOC126688279 n=1 Tax=Mercurialis annua TaxID=3986 RepID=UPI00215E50B4|nr:uncharacterized protein LOC126688279 [Mercurialis annua]
MAMTLLSSSSSSLHSSKSFFPIPNPKFSKNYPNSNCSSRPFIISTKRTKDFLVQRKKSQIWRIYASADEASLLPPPETAAPPEVVAASNDPTATVISTLLLIAFAVLSILTIGVIYLGVTDFLQNRQKEKFEKDEAAVKKKKGGKKRKIRARNGPRGFGQKINDDDDIDDL